MKIILTFLFFISFLFMLCSQKNQKVAITQRDTTITQANAFSELFLDSARVEQFITDQQIKDTAVDLLRNFYNSRNYEFAWFTQDGLAEQARAFWNLHNNYIDLYRDSSFVDKRLHQEMQLLTNEDTGVNLTSDDIVNTELQLTEHFFEYAQYAYAGKIDPKELQWHIPRKKINAIVLLD